MSDSTDVASLWSTIEDHLIRFLKLDAHERSVYYHLVRHSRLIGQRTVKVSIDSLAARTGLSAQVRNHLRALHAKGCVKIVERSRTGTLIEVFIPSEIPGCVPPPTLEVAVDLEALDFYTDPRGRAAILAREDRSCFYCLKAIDKDSAVLDHAVPQVQGFDNTYRNVVGCCHECSSLKAGMAAEDFVRQLYRRGRLSASELEARLASLAALARGDLRPVV